VAPVSRDLLDVSVDLDKFPNWEPGDDLAAEWCYTKVRARGRLPRQPGTKEARYMHLLSGEMEDVSLARTPSLALANNPGDNERLARLEKEVQEVRKEVVDLKQQLVSFRKQFE
jgi:hypothetical protein